MGPLAILCCWTFIFCLGLFAPFWKTSSAVIVQITDSLFRHVHYISILAFLFHFKFSNLFLNIQDCFLGLTAFFIDVVPLHFWGYQLESSHYFLFFQLLVFSIANCLNLFNLLIIFTTICCLLKDHSYI